MYDNYINQPGSPQEMRNLSGSSNRRFFNEGALCTGMHRVTEPLGEVEAPRDYSSRKLWWTLGLKGDRGPGEIWSWAEGVIVEGCCHPLNHHIMKGTGKHYPASCPQCPLGSSVGHILTEISWKGPHTRFLEHKEDRKGEKCIWGHMWRMTGSLPEGTFCSLKGDNTPRMILAMLSTQKVMVPQGSSVHGLRNVSFSRD